MYERHHLYSDHAVSYNAENEEYKKKMAYH